MKALFALLLLVPSYHARAADELITHVTESKVEEAACKTWEKDLGAIGNPAAVETVAEKKSIAERTLKQFQIYPGPNKAGRKAWAILLKQTKNPASLQAELAGEVRICAETSFAGLMGHLLVTPEPWNLTAKQKYDYAYVARRFVVEQTASPASSLEISLALELYQLLVKRSVVLLNPDQAKKLAFLSVEMKDSARRTQTEFLEISTNAKGRQPTAEETKKLNAMFSGEVTRVESIRTRLHALVKATEVVK